MRIKFSRNKYLCMKFLLFFLFISSISYPLLAEGDKKYQKEYFEEIKLLKIEYLNKKTNCVKASKNFSEMKKCWEEKEKY